MLAMESNTHAFPRFIPPVYHIVWKSQVYSYLQSQEKSQDKIAIESIFIDNYNTTLSLQGPHDIRQQIHLQGQAQAIASADPLIGPSAGRRHLQIHW